MKIYKRVKLLESILLWEEGDVFDVISEENDEYHFLDNAGNEGFFNKEAEGFLFVLEEEVDD